MFPDNVNREQSLRKILACETTALLVELHNVVSATFMVARPLRVDLQPDRISLRTNGKAGYASCNESSFPRVRLHVICLAAVIVSCKRSRNWIALVSPIDEVFVAEFFCQSAPKIKLRLCGPQQVGVIRLPVPFGPKEYKERRNFLSPVIETT